MKFNLVFPLAILICLLISCKKAKNEYESKYEAPIRINVGGDTTQGSFEDYFSSSKIIPLETKDYSLISNIDRISLFDNKIFILDKESNSILIFDDSGKYLNKIQNIGKGPYEYSSLMDFTIDEEKKHIILYTDRPYKLLVYGINGEFVKEKRLSNLYYDISYFNGNIVLLNKDADRKYMLYETTLNSFRNKGYLKPTNKDKFYQRWGIPRPYLIKDEKIHLFFPYSEFVYEYDENGIRPKYLIDFGKLKMPETVYKQDKSPSDIFQYAIDNKYGFGISNFRENKNYVIFSFGVNNIAIYSKKTQTSQVFNVITNPKDGIHFFNYFAHDGNDNKLISIYPSSAFKEQMDIYKSEERWKDIPENIKHLANEISELDNPLLVVYTFK